MSISAIILLGAPGAGKGTMAEAVKEAFHVTHIATGDMLREEIKNVSELGRAADKYMNSGRLVPDDLIIRMVMDRISRGADDARYMFDGFPRTLPQARLLDENFKLKGAALSLVILLEVTPDVCMERLAGRRVCRKCGANYHVRNIPPRVESVCDRCGGDLYQRNDDMPETVQNRLVVFQSQTADLVEFYERQGLLVRIDSTRPRDDTLADIMRVLKERFA